MDISVKCTSRLYPPFPDKLWSVVENASRLTLYMVLPEPRARWGDQTFHGYPVLGRVEVEEASFSKVIESLRRGIFGKSVPLRCWDPHHAIRARCGTRTVDIVMCFVCDVMQHFPTQHARKPVWGQVGQAPKRVLNRLLKKAGLVPPSDLK